MLFFFFFYKTSSIKYFKLGIGEAMRHGNDDNLPQGTCRQANTMEHVLNVLKGLMGGCRGSTWEAAT